MLSWHSCCHPLLLLVLCFTVPLQAGIVTSDILVTVSQGYAAEITGSPQDGRVDMLLAQRAPRLRGIVNGIDITEWDPATDIHLAEKWVAVCGGGSLAVPCVGCVHPGLLRSLAAARHSCVCGLRKQAAPHRCCCVPGRAGCCLVFHPCSYSAADLSGKAACKRALQREMRLEPDPDIPLIGFIGRLDYQKGPDLVLDALPALSNLDCQVRGCSDKRCSRLWVGLPLSWAPGSDLGSCDWSQYCQKLDV